MDDAGFRWYKDLALAVCVLVLFIAGIGVFFEPARTADSHHRVVYGIAVLGSAAVCVLFATSKSMVLGSGLATFAFRSAVAVVLQPTARPIFLGLAVIAALLLYALLRFQPQAKLPYDPDKSSIIGGVLAAATGFGLAALVLRTLTFLFRLRA